MAESRCAPSWISFCRETPKGRAGAPRTLSERATECAFQLCYHTRSTESNAFRDSN